MLKKAKVSASILAINYNDESSLISAIKMLEKSKVSMIHLDVMDGIFVKNKTFDSKLVEFFKLNTKLALDVHLMVNKPHECIDSFIKAGASMIAVHYEADSDIISLLRRIKAHGIKAGLAINPSTNVDEIKDIIKESLADYILVMSVEPGKYGQEFILGSELKISEIKNINKSMCVSVDGGVNLNNYKMLIKNGADILVSAGAIFKSDNPIKTIKKLSGGLF